MKYIYINLHGYNVFSYASRHIHTRHARLLYIDIRIRLIPMHGKHALINMGLNVLWNNYDNMVTGCLDKMIAVVVATSSAQSVWRIALVQRNFHLKSHSCDGVMRKRASQQKTSTQQTTANCGWWRKTLLHGVLEWHHIRQLMINDSEMLEFSIASIFVVQPRYCYLHDTYRQKEKQSRVKGWR